MHDILVYIIYSFTFPYSCTSRHHTYLS